MMEWLDAATPLVARYEGCKLSPYLDKLAKPPVWTRGYGRTYGITQDSPAITPDEAERELKAGLNQYGLACVRAAPALLDRPLCLAAVASRAWNCGVGSFKASRLRRAINDDRWDDAVDLMLKPDTAGGVVYRGLQRRRSAEATMFKAGIYGQKVG